MVVLIVLALIGGVAIAVVTVVLLGGDDPAVASQVQREPINTATDPFAPPGQVGQDLAVTPVQTAGVTAVEGGRVGLYGGTMSSAQCDKAQMVAFLQQNPDKAAAWADVVGIAPGDIPGYVERLTPLVLRSDTAVTNHGFVEGKATTIPAVLQAGTAVLVDDKGVPVTKCYCGNPLGPPTTYAPPATTTTTTFAPSTTTTFAPSTTTTFGDYPPPTYYGPEWPGWNPTSITIIQINITVINVFVLVDPMTGQTFNRPVGTDGAADMPVDAPSLPDEPCVDENNNIVPCPSPTTSSTAPAPSTTPTTGSTPTTTSPTASTTFPEPQLPDEPCVDENNNIVPCGAPRTTFPPTTFAPSTTFPEPRLPDEPCVDENNNIVPC